MKFETAQKKSLAGIELGNYGNQQLFILAQLDDDGLPGCLVDNDDQVHFIYAEYAGEDDVNVCWRSTSRECKSQLRHDDNGDEYFMSAGKAHYLNQFLAVNPPWMSRNDLRDILVA